MSEYQFMVKKILEFRPWWINIALYCRAVRMFTIRLYACVRKSGFIDNPLIQTIFHFSDSAWTNLYLVGFTAHQLPSTTLATGLFHS